MVLSPGSISSLAPQVSFQLRDSLLKHKEMTGLKFRGGEREGGLSLPKNQSELGLVVQRIQH